MCISNAFIEENKYRRRRISTYLRSSSLYQHSQQPNNPTTQQPNNPTTQQSNRQHHRGGMSSSVHIILVMGDCKYQIKTFTQYQHNRPWSVPLCVELIKSGWDTPIFTFVSTFLEAVAFPIACMNYFQDHHTRSCTFIFFLLFFLFYFVGNHQILGGKLRNSIM